MADRNLDIIAYSNAKNGRGSSSLKYYNEPLDQDSRRRNNDSYDNENYVEVPIKRTVRADYNRDPDRVQRTRPQNMRANNPRPQGSRPQGARRQSARPQNAEYDEEYLRIQRERRRRYEMRKRRAYRNRFIAAVIFLLLIFGIVSITRFFIKLFSKGDDTGEEQVITSEVDMKELSQGGGSFNIADGPYEDEEVEQQPITTDYSISKSDKSYDFEMDSGTVGITSDQVISDYAVLINCDTGVIKAQRECNVRMYPASMTKIMTVLVAAEQLGDISRLEDKVALTPEISNYIYNNDCSAVGFAMDEEVTVRDLFFGTILPSGADAAVMLATYIAGSHEAFVDLMNEKARELGIGDTCHFTNCVGLFNEDHYCTLIDMAVILNAAMDNDLSREALSTKRYTTSSTPEHPEGIDISNLFLRRIEDKDTGGNVIGAKTGFVNESRNCAASYYTSGDGTNYICVTGGANSSWRAIYDHVAVYNIYAIGNTSYVRGS